MAKKQESYTLSQICFKQWEVELYVDKTIGQLTTVITPRSLKKTTKVNYENSPKQIIALHFALTKKSELNPNDKGVFPQVCKTYSYKPRIFILREKKPA